MPKWLANLVQKSLKSNRNFTTELQPQKLPGKGQNTMPNDPKFGPLLRCGKKHYKMNGKVQNVIKNDTKEYKKAT